MDGVDGALNWTCPPSDLSANIAPAGDGTTAEP
jgi:hypothetical protein